jgi:hypothetical protein
MSSMPRPSSPTSRVLGLTVAVLVGCGRVGFRATPVDAAIDLDAPRAMDAALDAPTNDARRDDARALDAPVDSPVVDSLVVDSPPPDGGSDVGPDAPTARELVCRSASTLSCLTFDADPAPPWETWSTVDATSVRRRVADAGFRGGALEITIPATESGAGLRLPVAGESFRSGVYVSAWMRVSRATTSGFLVLVESNNGLGGAAQRKVSLDVNGLGDAQLVVVGGTSTEGAPAPLDRWVCLRLAIVDGSADAWFDADHLLAAVPFDVGAFSSVNVGGYSQGDATTLTIDDVVVSTVPVDCLPP